MYLKPELLMAYGSMLHWVNLMGYNLQIDQRIKQPMAHPLYITFAIADLFRPHHRPCLELGESSQNLKLQFVQCQSSARRLAYAVEST